MDRTAVAAIVCATSVAIIMLNLAPVAERYLREGAHLSTGQVGALFFVELAAMGLASLPAHLWLGRADASRVARYAYAAFILGNAMSSIYLSSFPLYAVTRAVTGFGAGTLMVLGMSIAARMTSPDRLYALITFAQLASGAVMLWFFSGTSSDGYGLHNLFHVSAWIGVLGFMTSGPLSRACNCQIAEAKLRRSSSSTTWTTTLLATAFAMVFNLVVGGLWSFAAEYAGAGTSPERVTFVLAWATAAGLAGAGMSFLIGSPAVRRRLLIAGYLGILLGSSLLHFARGPAGFAAGCCVLLLAWNFCVPSVFAAVACQDPTGRLMSAANLAFGFGLALGPLLAGAVIGSFGLDALFPCTLAGLALGVILTLRITRVSPA